MSQAPVALLEVKALLIELNKGVSFVNLDDILVDLKLAPDVLEVPVPKFFREDQERALELQGRISLFYGRPWDEVPRGATVPVTCEWTIASFSRQQQMQRPLSPAPVATDFDIEDKFLQERARWFRDHGGGGELDGSTRKQNEAFQRLKDRLFSLRRDRANPSGTPRASQRRASGAGSSTDPL